MKQKLGEILVSRSMIAKKTAHLDCTPMILDHHWTLTVALPPLHQKQLTHGEYSLQVKVKKVKV